MDYPNSRSKLQLDQKIDQMTLEDNPSTPIDRPKTDLAVQIARQFKNSVTFGNGGIRKNMDGLGHRSIDKKDCLGNCGKRKGCC